MFYIYRITNLVNGKTYIGQHKYKETPYDGYMGSGYNIKRAYKKHGIENFKKEILVFNISERKYVDLLEKTFIASEREKVGIENCYNIADGGQGGNIGARNEEWRRKQSDSHKGRYPSKETKRKISEALKGEPKTEEWKRNISESLKGKHKSEEHRKKTSEALKGRTPWNKGKHFGHLSDETKEKLSKLRKGKHWKLIDGKRVWY